ncbi:MAG: non-ribosomal peptide synthetase, partial [Acidobacteria bacterium]|nr:non-ribosomal peptide synthetase [Acidobacteriota bacterium]
LTAERFVPHPFATDPGARLYRTGDRARFRAGGELDFLGRLDDQVKVRGFRVEPGEVEVALAAHASVGQVVVAPLVEDGRGARLVAWVVPEDGAVVDAGELRRHLQGRLPDYMVPSAFVRISAVPLTANGKVDKRALPAPGETAGGAGIPSVAPRTEFERRLAAIWSSVLGVASVGIHDDFFELGGDSILSIQITSRAHREGIHFTTRQLFENPTVAELAAAVEGAGAVLAEQGEVTGEAPLLPIQRWFLEAGLESRHHTNMALLLELRRRFDAEPLAEALAALVAHHDALRLRFVEQEGAWRQDFRPVAETEVPLAVHDLSHLDGPERLARLVELCSAEQSAFDVTATPLFRAALFDLGNEAGQRLLLVAHHLVVDNVSWEILTEDLALAYRSAARGHAVDLAPKTTSFKRWGDRLKALTEAGGFETEVAYWADPRRAAVAPLPVDFPGGENLRSSNQIVRVSLEEEETRDLLGPALLPYRTSAVEILLAALVRAVGTRTGQDSLLVDFEGHGREAIFADANLARTVGWFTTLYPVLLEAPSADPRATLTAVKDQLRLTPHNGLGYGWLKDHGRPETREALAAQRPAPILFNFQGQAEIADRGADDLPFVLAGEAFGSTAGRDAHRTHLLDLEVSVRDGRLVATWDYSSELFRRETVEALAESYLAALRQLLDHCLSPDAGGFTTSDFPLATIGQAALDALAAQIGDLEDLYPLTPLQQGMLFHTLQDPEVGAYIAQVHNFLPGDLDLDAFREAWRRVARRNAVLRTSYHWDGLDVPLQAVHRETEIPVAVEDWRGRSVRERTASLRDYLDRDRRRGFEFSTAPLVRFLVVRETQDRYRTVATLHQSLLDGWSLPEVFQEFGVVYQALTAGVEPELLDRRPYRDYVEWMLRQDRSAAKRFWQGTLAGFTEPTPLIYDRPADESRASAHADRARQLSAAATAHLESVARTHRLTLNTLVQGAWA